MPFFKFTQLVQIYLVMQSIWLPLVLFLPDTKSAEPRGRKKEGLVELHLGSAPVCEYYMRSSKSGKAILYRLVARTIVRSRHGPALRYYP